MNRRLLVLCLVALLAIAAGAPVAHAAAGPSWDVRTSWGDTNLPPGGEGQLQLQVRNIGDAASEEVLTITDQLPAGVTATEIHWNSYAVTGTDLANNAPASFCSGIGTGTIACTIGEAELANLGGPFPDALPEGYLPVIFIGVEVASGAGAGGTNVAKVQGGGDPTPFEDVDQIPFDSTPSTFGVVPGSLLADTFDNVYPFGEPSRQAGGHPAELRVNFELNQKSAVGPDGTRYVDSNGLIRTVEVTLPRGMIGNPEALPKCDPVDFAESGSSPHSKGCPSDTQVGYLDVALGVGTERYGEGNGGYTNPFANTLGGHVAVYNLVPPKGQAADFGFDVGGYVIGHIYATLDPAQNYAIKTLTPNISALFGIDARSTEATFWGVPGDPVHDRYRYYPKNDEGKVVGAPFGATIRPFFTEPMDCGFDNGGARIRVESYEQAGVFSPVQGYGNAMNVSGCGDPRFRFEPDVELQPTSREAGASTGLAVHLKVPLRNDEAKDPEELYAQNGFVKGISTPPIKKAVVTFPEGMTINPAAAQGLGSCSSEQIGLGTDKPVTCPANSQYGTLALHTPLLPVDEQPTGFVYIAKQNDNPFHNFLSLYLVIQQPDKGILVKIPGRVDLDPQTGQITTTFDGLPQLPVSDMEMNLKGGLRAGLVNPQTCGKKTIEATFYSWQDPGTPHNVSSSFEVTRNPDGSPCHNSLSERHFSPALSGGTINNLAGSFSPLEIDMTRSDEEQELLKVEGTAPLGLLASLKGVGRCSDAAIAAASASERTGLEEIASPSCPASSQVGTVDAGAGVGQVLTYVSGKVYLAGPYQGAPLSGVAIVPAVAGPFDLGTIVTRAPAYVNPETAQITLRTDQLPLIFKGIPVRVRDIRVHVNRNRFILNPTNCEPMSLAGTLFSSEGKSSFAQSPFQAAECASLGFKPRLSIRLQGGTKRGDHPALKAVVRPRPGDANIGSAQVTLPHSAFLDQAHIRTICTRVQFAAKACPAGSVYGHATAISPLLDVPLQGPVYLRSSSHNLPDLVIALKGPPSLPIEFNLDGRIDSVKGGIRSSFEAVPDAPVTSFALEMEGGKKGLVVNSTNLCAKAHRASAKLIGQNGKADGFKPAVTAGGCTKAKKRPG